MGKLKIKVISGIKLHSSVLGLPVKSRRPLTCTSPTPNLNISFSCSIQRICWCGSWRYMPFRPLALPCEEGRLRKGAGLETCLCYSHDNSGLGSSYAYGRKHRPPAEAWDHNGCTHLDQRTIWPQLKVWSEGSPWRHSTKGHWTQFQSLNTIWYMKKVLLFHI